MTGGQFVAHPGNIQPYRVQIRDEEHPITEGVDDFDLVSEQYYMLVDPAIRVLADTRFHGIGADWVQDTLLPVAWIKPYGAGRVFYSAVGHQEADLEEPNSQRLILRGMLWAAGLL
jgi:type 1 glutamine amidotransferase